MAKMKNIFPGFLFIVLFFSHSWGSNAEGCAACLAASQLANENQNRALYALRVLYEKEGRAALPAIRESLKSNDNPPLQIRAAGYVVELNDTDSVPLLEEILSELVKRVSFSTFGVRSAEFQTRMFVAHSLAKLGSTRIADRIWERYDQINLQRKMEVPYILNALGDPKLTERLLGIISRGEDHQLMMVTLDALAMGGNSQALLFLELKLIEWQGKEKESSGSKNQDNELDYFVLRTKAHQVISKIEERISEH
jgi:hypothetical protein